MADRRKGIPERLVLHAILAGGSFLFALPFLWMIGTSFKVPREMSMDEMRLLPKAPHAIATSPYIDATQFSDPIRPEGVPEDVWQASLPDLRTLFGDRVGSWQPRLPESRPEDPPFPILAEELRTELVEGLFDTLRRRLGDSARESALGASNEGRAHEAVAVIVADADRIATDATLSEIFAACYRRISMGEVRVRTSDYRLHRLHTGTEWQTEQGSLLGRRDTSVLAQELQLDLQENPQITVRLVPGEQFDADPATIDRVYIGYRGDASWARIRFRVIRDGVLYETTERANLYERDWVEQELRWPAEASTSFQRRVHQVLERVGPAPAGSPAFAVEMVIEKNSMAGAWIDKALRNYGQTFREVPYARYLMTSFSLAILNILLSVFSCSFIAYGFARLEWPGRDACFLLLLATMMLPAQVTMIPTFLVMKNLGWYNTLLPLWVPAAFGTPFFIFLLRQFLKNIPRDLEDAARIDGCGFLGIYWNVMLPLVRPVLATISIFTFMWTWNNFLGPLIYVNDERLFPLALGLFKFNIASGDNVGLMMASSFIMTLPVIILFFFAQRYFIQGITLTGTKA